MAALRAAFGRGAETFSLFQVAVGCFFVLSFFMTNSVQRDRVGGSALGPPPHFAPPPAGAGVTRQPVSRGSRCHAVALLVGQVSGFVVSRAPLPHRPQAPGPPLNTGRKGEI